MSRGATLKSAAASLLGWFPTPGCRSVTGKALESQTEDSEMTHESTNGCPGGMSRVSRRTVMNILVGTAAVATAMPLAAAPALPAPGLANDSELLALAERFIAAERRYCDTLIARDELIDNNLRPPPEALRVSPRDFELGKKLFDSTDEFWHRPCDIGQWRDLTTYEPTQVNETTECFMMVAKKILPSEELRTRAEQIIAAYDAWRASNEKKPRGYKKAEREARRAQREYWDLQEEVVNTPAHTVEGMLAKIRCAEAWEGKERLDSINCDCGEEIALSIFEDIRRLAGTSHV